ncbi:hypothetical protein C8R41DRAFT_867391 [Lentinula lateritia]|uniref:Uncharacterized protein n=1 Tax=Lentinula lateritia TaxID=40482 RepID=A0ABQ8VIR8_9AGAR|nr:hypothetical protein C8R41DRAFT_867391 [Lentinula lateritia]
MDSDSISQDDKTAFAAEDSESLDAFNPPASRFATSISHISRTVIHIFQSPNMLYVLTMERQITRYFLLHGLFVNFLLAGKILSSTYNAITMILGADLGDVIAIALLMICARVISRHFLQDWKADVGISDLLFSRVQKTIRFLVVLSILSFAFATWRLLSFLELTLDLCFWVLVCIAIMILHLPVLILDILLWFIVSYFMGSVISCNDIPYSDTVILDVGVCDLDYTTATPYVDQNGIGTHSFGPGDQKRVATRGWRRKHTCTSELKYMDPEQERTWKAMEALVITMLINGPLPQEDGLHAIPTSNMVASVKNEEDGEDSLSSRTVSQEWRLCAISTMGMVTSGEDEEGVLLEVSMFWIPYLDATSWILLSCRLPNLALSSSSVFLSCCTELIEADEPTIDKALCLALSTLVQYHKNGDSVRFPP